GDAGPTPPPPRRDAGEPPSPPGVWRPFADDSPWNTPIPADVAIRSDSDALVEALATSSDWPGLQVAITPWSVPVYEVGGAGVPLVEVHSPISNEGLEHTFRWPVPPDAAPAPESDAHMTIIDRATGREYDFWAARRRADGSWECGLCSTADLDGSGVRPPKGGARPWYESHGSRACGFPLMAGLIRAEELAAGRIEHALVLAYPALRRRWFTPPASTGHPDNGLLREDFGIPCGGRVQLDPSVDVDALGLSPAGRAIARALQEYGAYVGDFAGSINVYADGSPEAQAAFAGVLDAGAMHALDLGDLRVVEWGELTPDG
ncbi:MAG TPA: hypothetical protein RMH99_19390, partial [Sandaracinaceae bacterium LLY-WYZ-13_1]|nr:hypothetical protein [Sandaracinaceae bacterium LLY-WYZ-13_1]